jgi:hypothetical protein
MLAEPLPKSTNQPLRKVARVVYHTLRSGLNLPLALWRYARTGRTTERGYQAFIWLFCISGGRLNDLLSWVIARLRPPVAVPGTHGVLGEMDGSRARDCADRLRRDGYLVFERALPAEACDRLMRFALETPAVVRRMDHEPQNLPKRTALFNAKAPLAVRYDYDTGALLADADVQALLADPSLLHLVQAYLGCEPVADVLSMWWHTGYHTAPDSEAAQYFHFDLDRIKWLKVFVYLTDVGPDNGPHTFVAGSHRTSGIPPDILHRGYVRLSDEEVYGRYGGERCRQFCAPRGSIIVEDTRGLHKGAHVRADPRLILQLQFSNSLFGASYPQARMGRVVDPGLKSLLDTAPRIFRQYQ